MGGNAIEILCGGQIRQHDDLDFFVLKKDAEALVSALESMNFSWLSGSIEDGDVFYKRADLILDIVPILENPPQLTGKLTTIDLPVDFLDDYAVSYEGEAIRTMKPAMHCAMKSAVAAFYGAEFREKDKIDLAALERYYPSSVNL